MFWGLLKRRPRVILTSAARRVINPNLSTSKAEGLHTARLQHFQYYYENEEVDNETSTAQNTAAAALSLGVDSKIVEFQIGIDEAITRFNIHQSAACGGMHAHGLLSHRAPTTVRTAYLPSWCFDCVFTAEFKGMLGYKGERSSDVVWREMEEWQTLVHKKALGYQEQPYMQVYASYNYERSLGQGAVLPSAACLTAARPLKPVEAATLTAPAGAAAAPSAHLRPEQQGPAGKQEPLSSVSDHGVSSLQESTPGGGAGDAAGGQEQGAGDGMAGNGVVIHAPDMSRAIAWQLAYRGLVREQTHKACAEAMQAAGACDARDMHVVIQIHSLRASLLYLPVYIAHYQHGQRYRQGTSSVVTAQMFYAAISGLEQGRVVALSHVSPHKAQAATAAAVGGLGLAAGSGPTWLGLEPFMSMGVVESVTLAVIGAALAGMWAQGLPQALQNNIITDQVKAEREFYRQYDIRETKTAAAIAAAMLAAEAEGRTPRPPEAGEQADEYIQWLWMDHDWRRWESDEPWNWDASKRRRAAEQIAARTVARRKERQRYLEKLLEDRRKRQYEAEQDMQRSRGRGGPRAGRAAGARGRMAAGDFASDGTSVGSEVLRRRRDFLGYYKLMGLGEEDDVTAELIKDAFKAQAMQLHPDRVMATGGTQESTKEAHVRFQRLQIAYDVLRDPEKRMAYDRGQLVQ